MKKKSEHNQGYIHSKEVKITQYFVAVRQLMYFSLQYFFL